MLSLLLAIIYITFISLGLPDSILGSAWPSMYGVLEVPLSYAGIITMIISGGTIVSSLFSHRLICCLGTGMVTLISVAMTAVALFGFSFSNSFWLLCLWSIPYGLGAGSVDAALNNFVALHYEAKHMSWLHCFWGIGATLGPYIMGLCLTRGLNWPSGYRTIGIVQTVFVFCLIISLPLWKMTQKDQGLEAKGNKVVGLKAASRQLGVKPILAGFFCYCSLEATAGLWASSYLVLKKGIGAQTAAKWAAIFYLGITTGRLLAGFITGNVGIKNMVRGGQVVAGFGIMIMMLPFGKQLSLLGLVLIGLGCAPIFPSLLHQTPENFGEDKSQTIMGMQMAAAYIGTTFMPLLFGFITEQVGMGFYPLYLMFFVLLMLIMVEKVNRIQGYELFQKISNEAFGKNKK
ncbi:MAG: MFS transporter [Firmicutes bacterium]|nr:MFS transporter [Bacillota bacterium]